MIDLHCDTILRLQTEKDSGNLRHNSLSVSLEGLTEINAQAQCFALFTPQEAEDRWAFMRSMHLRFEREVGDNSDLIHKASAPDGSLCAILTIEDMGPTEGLEERVDEVLSWKPRIIGLVWNNENVYARPCSKTAAEMEKGLTEEGRRLAERLAGEHVIGLLEPFPHDVRHLHLSERGVQCGGVGLDEPLRGGLFQNLNTEERAILLEKRPHHLPEGGLQLFPGIWIERIVGGHGEAVSEDGGVASVEPRVVVGAQSKKGRTLFCLLAASGAFPGALFSFPEDCPSSPFSDSCVDVLRRPPTGMLYFSAKYFGSTS